MRLFYIHFFLLLTYVSFGQTKTTNNNFEYYKLINLAELSIVDSAYNKALDNYQEAFSKTKSPMSKDLHNACVCALKTKKYDEVFDFFDKLVQKGVKFDYFKSSVFKPIHNIEKWKEFEIKYPKKNKEAKSKFNLELKYYIDAMHGRDQDLAVKKNEDPNFRPKFHTEVKKNEKTFVRLIKEFGFPSEDAIGVDEPDNSKISILLFHFMQKRGYYDSGNDSLDYYLLNAIQDGEFDPYGYANLVTMDNTNKTEFGETAIIVVNDKYFGIRAFTKEEELIVNKNRKSIGLETINDYHRKAMYAFNHPEINKEFKLHFPGFKSEFQFKDNSGDYFWQRQLESGNYKQIENENFVK
jgi:hypothetical protein